MGNTIDQNAKFDGGYLYIKTDREYYYPGNKVLGKIYLRIERDQPFEVNCIELRIKGYEKAKFTVITDDEENRYQRRRYYKRIIDFRSS